MCVVALSLAVSPRWPLVVAANRDEFHARPSAPLAPWDDAPHILGGRDLVSGGGWIGISTEGRLAVVTNVAGHPRGPDAPSRGALVSDFLRDGSTPAVDTLAAYGGFSLITCDTATAAFRTNQPAIAYRHLAPGLHGISNGPLDPPSPRTNTLTAALGAWVDTHHGTDALPELLDLLTDEETTEPEELAVFIRRPIYGTRCSTVIAVDSDGDGIIIERRFAPSGTTEGETRLDFRWPRSPLPSMR